MVDMEAYLKHRSEFLSQKMKENSYCNYAARKEAESFIIEKTKNKKSEARDEISLIKMRRDEIDENIRKTYGYAYKDKYQILNVEIREFLHKKIKTLEDSFKGITEKMIEDLATNAEEMMRAFPEQAPMPYFCDEKDLYKFEWDK